MTRGDGCFSAAQKAQCHAAQESLLHTKHSHAQYDTVQAQDVRHVNHYLVHCHSKLHKYAAAIPQNSQYSLNALSTARMARSKLLQHAVCTLLAYVLACTQPRAGVWQLQCAAAGKGRVAAPCLCACVFVQWVGWVGPVTSQCLAQLSVQPAALTVLINHKGQCMCIQCACVNGALR